MQPEHTTKHGPSFRDLTGLSFNNLTIIGFVEIANRKSRWKCLCVCGKTTIEFALNLKNGVVKDCGCITRRKHGMARSPEYVSWHCMKQRCLNPKNASYQYYGGRGVQVHAEWARSFSLFYRDMGPMPATGYTLERKDSNGHYEPSNCIWATRLEQQRNTSLNRNITFQNETQCLTAWASRLGISPAALRYRLKHWTLEKALTASIKEKG